MVDLIWNAFSENKISEEEILKKTFLEPSCGIGNFLIEILQRKLKLCQNDQDILIAYKSLFGIEIQTDNVEECKKRLLTLNPVPSLHFNLKEILDENIIVGDFLAMQGLDPNNQYKPFKKKK